MLTTERLTAICARPVTIHDRLIKIMHSQFRGACLIGELVTTSHMERGRLLLHCRKCPYLAYDRSTKIVKLLRRRKNIHEFGKLYDNPSEATSVHDFVFSLLYHAGNDLTFEDTIDDVQHYCKVNRKQIGMYATNKNIFGTVKKEVKVWLD